MIRYNFNRVACDLTLDIRDVSYTFRPSVSGIALFGEINWLSIGTVKQWSPVELKSRASNTVLTGHPVRKA